MSGVDDIRVQVDRDVLRGQFIARTMWTGPGLATYGARGKSHPTVGEAIYSLGETLCRMQTEHPDWFPGQAAMAPWV